MGCLELQQPATQHRPREGPVGSVQHRGGSTASHTTTGGAARTMASGSVYRRRERCVAARSRSSSSHSGAKKSSGDGGHQATHRSGNWRRTSPPVRIGPAQLLVVAHRRPAVRKDGARKGHSRAVRGRTCGARGQARTMLCRCGAAIAATNDARNGRWRKDDVIQVDGKPSRGKMPQWRRVLLQCRRTAAVTHDQPSDRQQRRRSGGTRTRAATRHGGCL